MLCTHRWATCKPHLAAAYYMDSSSLHVGSSSLGVGSCEGQRENLAGEDYALPDHDSINRIALAAAVDAFIAT